MCLYCIHACKCIVCIQIHIYVYLCICVIVHACTVYMYMHTRKCIHQLVTSAYNILVHRHVYMKLWMHDAYMSVRAQTAHRCRIDEHVHTVSVP